MRSAILSGVLIVLSALPSVAAAEPTVITVFNAARIEFDRDVADGTQRDGYLVRNFGRTIETTAQLPAAPRNLRDAQRIVASVTVVPVQADVNGRPRPGDRWTRIGSVTVLIPSDDGSRAREVELMRFTTGFGGEGTFTQDLTALAPLLDGDRALRVFISTYDKPAWEVSLTLTYTTRDVGYRRPILAQPLFSNPLVTAEQPLLRASVRIPAGLARPRLRIISTGHATDGGPDHEFISCTHVLRIDGREIARWRPWSEHGAELRRLNPWAGRMTIDGRELWSSDFDRSGWHPGSTVEPLLIPVPELTAGRHQIELEIIGIRPEDENKARGYWRLSAVVVADEPWPNSGRDREGTPNAR